MPFLLQKYTEGLTLYPAPGRVGTALLRDMSNFDVQTC